MSLSAQKALKKANAFFEGNQFSEAIPLFEKVLAEKENTLVRYRLAHSFFRLNQLDKAAAQYEQIVGTSRAKPVFWQEYGLTLVGLGDCEQAQEWLARYAAQLPEEVRGQQPLTNCDKIRDLPPYFDNIAIERFAHNSDGDDNSPVFYDNALVFCSDRLRRNLNIFKERSGMTGRDFLYVYKSNIKLDGTYTDAELFSNKVNALNKNTGPATFDKMHGSIIYSRNGDRASRRNVFNMQIYEAHFEKGKWKNETLLPFCSKEFNYMHPSLTPSGDTLYFVSDKAKGLGGTDIYMAHRKKGGKGWASPQRLDERINTPENEGFPFAAADGKLFFCSKGHLGFGGFDIFMAQLDEAGNWAQPVNLGKPINSSADDVSICFTDDMSSGAFASSRGRADDDIYLFETNLARLAKSEDDSPSAMQLVAPKQQRPMVVPMDRLLVKEAKVADAPNDSAAQLVPTHEDFKGYRINDLAIRLKVEKMAIGKIYILDIGFNEKGTVLSPEGQVELDKLAEVLQNDPALKVELGCHSNSEGDDADNMLLTERRAQVLKDYLISKGIEETRLEAHGYGETKLLNHCKNGVVCTPSQHQENERVELKVLDFQN